MIHKLKVRYIVLGAVLISLIVPALAGMVFGLYNKVRSMPHVGSEKIYAEDKSREKVGPTQITGQSEAVDSLSSKAEIRAGRLSPEAEALLEQAFASGAISKYTFPYILLSMKWMPADMSDLEALNLAVENTQRTRLWLGMRRISYFIEHPLRCIERISQDRRDLDELKRVWLSE